MGKTKTSKTGKTVQSASAKTIAKGVFAANPDMKEVHVTSDGTAFYDLCDAKNHARSLKNKAVVSLTKAEAYASNDTEPKDDTYKVEVKIDGDNYKKIIHKDGKIYGAIIQGDLSYAGVLTQLIKENIDISKVTKSIFDIDYADFFNMKENFEFIY